MLRKAIEEDGIQFHQRKRERKDEIEIAVALDQHIVIAGVHPREIIRGAQVHEIEDIERQFMIDQGLEIVDAHPPDT